MAKIASRLLKNSSLMCGSNDLPLSVLRYSSVSSTVLALTASLLESESIEANHIFDSYLQKTISKTDLLEALAGFLPYSEGTEIEENEQTIKDELPEGLIEILKLEVFELLEQARNDGDMERVKSLSTAFRKSQTGKNRYLEGYAQVLIRAVDLFDIETIEKELETFRRMVKS